MFIRLVRGSAHEVKQQCGMEQKTLTACLAYHMSLYKTQEICHFF